MTRLGWLAIVVGLISFWVPSAVGASLRPADTVTGPANSGVFSFTPVGARTAWALTQGSRAGDPVKVLRSTDAGALWSDVTPPRLTRGESPLLGSIDVLSATRAWLLDGDRDRPTVLRTSDGGRTWRRLGRAPGSCLLQFANPRDGWCVGIVGAAGSEAVAVYRTTSGGQSWRGVSFTAAPGSGTRATLDALPFQCDKTLTITGPVAGFASSACAGGGGFVYRTADGGARWQRVLSVAAPRGGSDGTRFTPVLGRGLQASMGYTSVGYHAPDLTIVYHSIDAGRRWTAVRPPDPHTLYDVDIVSADIWRLSAGHTVLSTDDAGRRWRRVRADITLSPADQVIFTTARNGWDVPTGDGQLRYTRDGGRRWTPVRLPG